MGLRVLPNTLGVFWGYKTHRQWTLGFRRTHAGCFEVTNSPPMGPRVPPNLIGVFWGYISPANGPLGSAKPNRGFWGYKSPPMGPQVPLYTIIIF
ncbi:Hypothetical protein FKW44_007814 [Caligus rogercresseyi]|uniref:Uncharacterized protein n=1 Tax=Caligus rogercresseyi TaxID=217165 RepID=A0A7T8QTT6_CALRO|nr:Hypothetical protein FKW44_007814 [Caligus rogercresseyi]